MMRHGSVIYDDYAERALPPVTGRITESSICPMCCFACASRQRESSVARWSAARWAVSRSGLRSTASPTSRSPIRSTITDFTSRITQTSPRKISPTSLSSSGRLRSRLETFLSLGPLTLLPGLPHSAAISAGRLERLPDGCTAVPRPVFGFDEKRLIIAASGFVLQCEFHLLR